MSGTALRNIAIIAAIALAVAFLPGGSTTAELVLAILSLAFLAAIGFLGYRLYMENKFTLWSMSDRHRAQLYGGLAVAFMTLTATDRLLDSGLGFVIWIALLTGSVLAVRSYCESDKYFQVHADMTRVISEVIGDAGYALRAIDIAHAAQWGERAH